MNLTDWFRPKRTTIRDKALSLYSRGIANANANSPGAAIENYTDAIELPDAPGDVVARAMFNRALALVAVGEFAKGVDDLSTVLDMPNAPEKVKRIARQKLAKRESHIRRNESPHST